MLTASSDAGAAAFDAAQAERGIRIERVPGSILFFPTPAALAAVRTAVADHGIDLVLLDPALPLGLLGPHLDVPYGVILHGAEITVPARLPGSRAALGRVLRARSLSSRPAAIRRGGAPRRTGPDGAAGRDPPGVDTGAIVPLKAPERRAARARLGLPARGPLLVSVSRLVPAQGHGRPHRGGEPPLSVLSRPRGGHCGRRPGARRLRRLAAESPVRVEVLGRVSEEDRAALLGAADLFVMACHNRWAGLEQEGFGIVFLEAAAAGVPQVAGDSGGASEAVLDGETGLVVGNPGDPGAVAEVLRRLLVDPVGRRRMGRAARSRVQETFDNELLASRLADALAGVAI